ncbi:hypothetical protein NW768_011340 [Fusarium equiseti]|uniref:Uncharacterized protein n=1 Tax=Fusarium equiseti TaxID=61235 RepID=A0ABQ8QXU6_FUSEQ|nr:hypothetical protein NW768_011340 [Fusarium equiseti]
MQNNSASTKVTGESDHSPRLNFGENRKGVLSAFDFRNGKILNPKTPALYGTLDEVNEAIAMLRDPDLIRTNSEVEWEKKKQAKSSPSVVGVRKVYDLVHNDPHGGLSYFYYTASDDPSTRTPRDRSAYLYWMGYKSPVMVRALELTWKYVRDEGLRVLIYVDTLRLLCITVGLFRLASSSFDTVTVRPDHDANEKNKVIAARNDHETFVGNVNTMRTGVNMHGCCSKGLSLNWLMNAKSMLQIIERLIRINQDNPMTFHLLKTKNSYHDNIERICCIKWANHAF